MRSRGQICNLWNIQKRKIYLPSWDDIGGFWVSQITQHVPVIKPENLSLGPKTYLVRGKN